MATDKRQRQKEANRQRREAALAAQRRAERRRNIRNLVLLAVAVVGLALVVSLTARDDDSDDVETAEGTDTTAPTATDPTVPPPDQENAALGADGDDGAGPFQYGTGPCPPADGAEEPVTEFEAAPELCIDPSKSYTAVFKTNQGDIEVALDTTRTPGTTNNFVTLAEYGYYDGTSLFRTEKQTGIIQGGSPHTEDGTDPGPGYALFDEGGPFLPAPEEGLIGPFQDYSPGTLAMARAQGPDSAAAQFFFVARDAQYLAEQGTYVVFGKTVEGLDVLEKIADLDDGSGKPSEPVVIESVEIRES